ncbi:hypothetical protein ABIC09_004672 [Bradyrhizobium sp. S3.12.5]|uniref:lytic transglycosylase domain-containing protein n=1 Tax=Bradyrhizobium sp. S3.12.5 TaxID=3156386 RepID=UPI00339A393C
MIVRFSRLHLVVPLFDLLRDHSSVPRNICKVGVHSGTPERPYSRREATLPWTGASTVARSHWFERSLRTVIPLLVALIATNSAAVAETRPGVAPARYRTNDPVADFFEEASHRFGIPVRWVLAVIDVESAGDMRATSRKGAMGLMQIMPETWAELRLRYGLGNNPYNPRDNILAGTAYLRELHDRYGSPGFLAAYNAGPGRYEEHLAGRPLPAETQAYLQKLVIGSDIAASGAVASLRPPSAALFVVRSESTNTADPLRPGRSSNRAPTAASVHDISAIVPQATGLFVARPDAGGSR